MSIEPLDGFRSKKPWPEGAVEDRQHGASYSWLAREYGRAYGTISHLIGYRKRRFGIKPIVDMSRRRKGGRLTFAEQDPISQMHRNIGVKVNYFREVLNDLNYEELGAKLGVNRLIVRKIELGLHDLTLSQLNAVSALTGYSFPELTKQGVSFEPQS